MASAGGLSGLASMFSEIRNLHRLRVNIKTYALTSASSGYMENVLAANVYSMMHMRNVMLKNRGALPPLSGHGIRLRISQNRGRTVVYRDIELAMDIDCQDRAYVRPERRVKVRPDAWCYVCGKFMVLAMDNCACTFLDGKFSGPHRGSK